MTSCAVPAASGAVPAEGAVLDTCFTVSRAAKALQRVPMVRPGVLTGIVERPRRMLLAPPTTERPTLSCSMADLFFYLFAALTAGSALGVVLNKNIVAGALCLLLTILGTAGLFVLLNAYLLAVKDLLPPYLPVPGDIF